MFYLPLLLLFLLLLLLSTSAASQGRDPSPPTPTPTPCPCPCDADVPHGEPPKDLKCDVPMPRPEGTPTPKPDNDPDNDIVSKFWLICYDPTDQSVNFEWLCRWGDNEEHFDDWRELVCDLVGCEPNKNGCKPCCIEYMEVNGKEWPLEKGCPAEPTPTPKPTESSNRNP